MPLALRRNLRWVVAGMLCLVTIINYLDRQTLSLIAPTVSKEFHMSDKEYSYITTSFQMAYLAAGRVLQAGVRVDPKGAAAAAERAFAVIRQLGYQHLGTRLETEVRSFYLVSLLDCGDPEGFVMLDAVERYVAGLPRQTPDIATALWNAYACAVVSMFHEHAAGLHERCVRTIERHELGWLFRVHPYRALELVQRGRYDEARSVAAAKSTAS